MELTKITKKIPWEKLDIDSKNHLLKILSKLRLNIIALDSDDICNINIKFIELETEGLISLIQDIIDGKRVYYLGGN